MSVLPRRGHPRLQLSERVLDEVDVHDRREWRGEPPLRKPQELDDDDGDHDGDADVRNP